MPPGSPQYSIIIPVYRSGVWMDELVERVWRALEPAIPNDYELVLVNDCSPDTITWPAIQTNAAKHPWVRGVNLLYNVGQFRATLCGMAQARGRFVLTMDDDLQHLPEELPKLVSAMLDSADADCIMGSYEGKKHARIRNLGSRIYHRLMASLYGQDPNLETTSFRIMRRELSDAIIAYRTVRPQIAPQIAAITTRIKNIPVAHAPRQQGKSGYNLWKLVATTLDSVIHGSTLPLRFFSLVGFLCAALSMVLGVFYLARRLSGGIQVAGFTTQILLITFFGGLTLAGIGILGEYVARIITEVTGPERYRIRETTPSRDNP